ncbi:MAG: hypothetical protein R8G66_03070 [Cytophagales bacterium]|nr:hypothetical protein [Cytophagales bacterium]
MMRRVKYTLFTYVLFGVCLFAFSSCEEDSEILDNLEIKKETDDDKSTVEQPAINSPGGN